tara:strand:- start:112 stop:348 length:237 start_codon:yes stop_codon:yes gene_type:complete
MNFEQFILNLTEEQKLRYLKESAQEKNVGMFQMLSTILSVRDKQNGGIDKKTIELIYKTQFQMAKKKKKKKKPPYIKK